MYTTYMILYLLIQYIIHKYHIDCTNYSNIILIIILIILIVRIYYFYIFCEFFKHNFLKYFLSCNCNKFTQNSFL